MRLRPRFKEDGAYERTFHARLDFPFERANGSPDTDKIMRSEREKMYAVGGLHGVSRLSPGSSTTLNIGGLRRFSRDWKNEALIFQ